MKRVAKLHGLILLLVLSVVSCTQEDPIEPGADARGKFVGTWGVTETQVKAYYEVTIRTDPNSTTRVLINNFAGLGESQVATAIISGNNITLDPNQDIAGFTVTGGGTISGSTSMSWTYSLNDGADITNYTAIFTKK